MRFSIIIPVLNEEALLEDQLTYLTQQYARQVVTCRAFNLPPTQ